MKIQKWIKTGCKYFKHEGNMLLITTRSYFIMGMSLNLFRILKKMINIRTWTVWFKTWTKQGTKPGSSMGEYNTSATTNWGLFLYSPSHLSMKEGSLFVLFCTYEIHWTGCFKLRFWSLWKALEHEGCISLVPRHLDLRCKSSWILNDFFTEN